MQFYTDLNTDSVLSCLAVLRCLLISACVSQGFIIVSEAPADWDSDGMRRIRYRAAEMLTVPPDLCFVMVILICATSDCASVGPSGCYERSQGFGENDCFTACFCLTGLN